jgi:hypothetical protein
MWIGRRERGHVGVECEYSRGANAALTILPLLVYLAACASTSKGSPEIYIPYASSVRLERDAIMDAAGTRQSAEAGDPAAQRMLAALLYMGFDVPRDVGEACNWWRRAAQKGDAVGQNSVAQLCSGELPERLEWLRESAAHGFSPAQHILGVSYWYGNGVDLSSIEEKDARIGRSKAEVEQGEERQESVLVEVEKAQLQPFHVIGYVHESGNLYALTILRDVDDRADLRSMHVVGNIDDGAELRSMHLVSDVGNARKLRTEHIATTGSLRAARG